MTIFGSIFPNRLSNLMDYITFARMAVLFLEKDIELPEVYRTRFLLARSLRVPLLSLYNTYKWDISVELPKLNCSPAMRYVSALMERKMEMPNELLPLKRKIAKYAGMLRLPFVKVSYFLGDAAFTNVSVPADILRLMENSNSGSKSKRAAKCQSHQAG